MDMAKLLRIMEYLPGNTRIIKNMDMESMNGQMAVLTMVTGVKASNTDQENIKVAPTVKSCMAYGSTAN